MAKYPPLGAQLIVFSKQIDVEGNIESVLEAVKEAGFEAIEIGAAFGADDPAAFRSILDSKGLAVAALHGGLEQDLDLTLELMDVYGARDLCISGIGGWEGTSADRYLEDIEALNGMARVCAQHDVYLHYHNHAYEFVPTDQGPCGMDLILSGMDTEVAHLCVDVAWVHIAGQDPAQFLLEHADDVGYVHLKDYEGDHHWVELGAGVVPLSSVMDAVEELPHVRWVVYEQDTSDSAPAESCATSHRYLVNTFGYG